MVKIDSGGMGVPIVDDGRRMRRGLQRTLEPLGIPAAGAKP